MSRDQQAADKNVWCRNLRVERERLGLTQDDVAASVAVASKTVSRWEASIPIPADKLAALAEDGWDVLYILTGQRKPSPAGGIALTADEAALLACWRDLTAEEREALAVLLGRLCPDPLGRT